jgi:hypothetical protein
MNTQFKFILKCFSNTLQHLNYVNVWHKDIEIHHNFSKLHTL